MRFDANRRPTKDYSMTRTLSAFVVLALVATSAIHATAQTVAPAPTTGACTPEHAKMGHCKMDGAAPATATNSASDTASTKAFKAANDKMHGGMNIPFSGNADVDFVKGMVPHHQGAVDMAKIVLEHGKDPGTAGPHQRRAAPLARAH
jgi:uncharacterized protein (DUF305 family)